MQKLLFTLFAFAIWFGVKAQSNVYHPFPDSNAVWQVSWESGSSCTYDPPFNTNMLYAEYQYTLGGDTTMGVYTYKKVYQSGNFNLCNTTPYYSSHEYAGGIRQDSINKKIYFKYQGNNPDTLLYDFSKNVGDTIRLSGYMGGSVSSYTATINSIDSVLMGSNYHKRFNISSYDGGSIIEGVGATSGLLEGSNMVIMSEENFILDCFHHNTDYYPTTNIGCNTLGIKTSNIQSSALQVYPNPSNGSFIIETNATTKQTMQVYDVNGKLVLTQTIQPTPNPSKEGNRTTIDASNLNEGVYNINIISNEGVVNKRMIIVR